MVKLPLTEKTEITIEQLTLQWVKGQTITSAIELTNLKTSSKVNFIIG